jgi:hypothetical protein
MADATLILLADAVAVRLNAEAVVDTFAERFTAARRNLPPPAALPDLVELRVTVVPGTISGRWLSRSQRAIDYAIDVGLQRRVPGTAEEAGEGADAVLLLAEEVGDLLLRTPLTLAGGLHARPTDVTQDPAWWPSHLEELRVATVVLRATYQVWRVP